MPIRSDASQPDSRPCARPRSRGWLAAGLALLAACGQGGPEEMAEAPSPFDSIVRTPREIQADVPIGTPVPDLQFLDRHFLWRSLDDLGERRATVILVTTPECPVAKRVIPGLVPFEREFRERGVAFVAIDPSPAPLVEAVAQGLDARAGFPFAKDPGGVAATALGATHTPTACVLDADGRLVYRGRVDDRIRTTGQNPNEGREHLREALEDVLAGRQVREPETNLEGCPITLLDVEPAPHLTWTGGVGDLVRNRCGTCHRPGDLAPFILWRHDQVVRRASVIAEVLGEERMPPWFARERDTELGHAEFINRRALEPNERDGLLAWLKAGAPRGEMIPDPPLPLAADWRIGKPDLVLTGKPTTLPASGVIDYTHQVIEHVFEHDTWIDALEVRGSVPGAQHHLQVKYIDANVEVGDSDELGKQGRLLGVYVPGRRYEVLEPGTALHIPAGSALVLEIHYVTTGREVVDTPAVGLRFPRTPVKRRVRHHLVYDWDFEMPAEDPSFVLEFERTRRRPTQMSVRSILPHLHLRGKSFEVWAQQPDQPKEILLQVPAWSFDWQFDYRFEPGSKLYPKETKFGARVEYDNSSYNPFNPAPEVAVFPGQNTEDEMAIFWISFTDPNEVLNIQVNPRSGRSLTKYTPRRAPLLIPGENL